MTWYKIKTGQNKIEVKQLSPLKSFYKNEINYNQKFMSPKEIKHFWL